METKHRRHLSRHIARAYTAETYQASLSALIGDKGMYSDAVTYDVHTNECNIYIHIRRFQLGRAVRRPNVYIGWIYFEYRVGFA